MEKVLDTVNQSQRRRKKTESRTDREIEKEVMSVLVNYSVLANRNTPSNAVTSGPCTCCALHCKLDNKRKPSFTVQNIHTAVQSVCIVVQNLPTAVKNLLFAVEYIPIAEQNLHITVQNLPIAEQHSMKARSVNRCSN